jgi:CheY-like chemotaxis protein
VLELTFDSVLSSALGPAADVLESADGSLGPAGDGSGAWVLRAPVATDRDLFLLVEQGRLRLALPWHAVVKVRLVATDGIDGFLARQRWSVLAPFAEPEERLPERPVILVALGLRRAALVADRLIWRMACALVEPPGAPPAEGLRRAVRTDSGESYWMVEPRWVLRDVEPLGLPEPQGSAVSAVVESPIPREPIPLPARHESAGTASEAPGASEAPSELAGEAVESLEVDVHEFEVHAAESELVFQLEPEVHSEPESEVEPEPESEVEPAPESEVEPAPESEVRASEAPTSPSVLQADSVEPLLFDAPPAVTAAVIDVAEAVAPPAVTAAAPATAIPAADASSSAQPQRSALVAEDSIIARVFLTRLLEQQGYRVHGVATAIELRGALARGGFTIVFADVELPDGRGVELLRPLAVEAFGAGIPLVALVRDAADSDAARSAGVTHHLRKPYEREALDRLLLRLQQVAGR